MYADSYRMSRWLYLGDSDLSQLTDIASSRSSGSATSMGTCDSISDLLDLDPDDLGRDEYGSQDDLDNDPEVTDDKKKGK